MSTVDEKATTTAVRIPIREAVSKDPELGRAAAINAMPERPSSTARATAKSAVTRARAFNNTMRKQPRIRRKEKGG